MKMDHSHLDWMSRDVELWEHDENYLKLFQAVNEFTIVKVKGQYRWQKNGSKL